MGTVGLSFGSATSGAGFDVSSTVTSILAIESGVETPWKAQLTSLQAQDTALSGLGTNLSTLSTALTSLTDFDGLFAAKQGSSSNTNVLTLTSAGTTAVAGSHTITVNLLAQTSSEYTDRIAAATDTLSGSLNIAIGSGTGQSITLDSTDDTLTTLAAKINNGSYGVTANVITDTQGSRLSLNSNTSGAAGQITLTSSLTDTTTNKTLNFNTGQTGQDAQLQVDGISLTSGSNTVTNAIPGVTFQLLSAALNTPVQVEITNDNTAIETQVQSFVTAYNAVNTAIKTQEGNTSAGVAEPLFGSPTLALLQSQLTQALYAGKASGSISSITQLGLTVGEDGSLSFDSTALDSTLNSDYNDVAGFFQNASSFGGTLTSTLNSLGNSQTTGAISLALTQDALTEAGLNTDITNENARIATDKTTLTTELNTANEELQAIPSQLNEVNELYSAITGYNQSQQ